MILFSMTNRGWTGSAYGLIDQLTYSYNASIPNRLTTVAEASSTTKGFKSLGGVGYGYDANGNVTTDSYKGITRTVYNYLNLPDTVFFGTKYINFTYDAAGTKWRKKTVDGALVTEKHYLGGLEYNSNTLEAIYHSEGRAVPITGGYEYQYTIRDHLGNSRVMYKLLAGTPAIVQEGHYYAFGMELENTGYINGTNKYRYNGKEMVDDFGFENYDYGARYYGVSSGRWGQVDPLADKNIIEGPNIFVHNNPLKYIDPDGKDAILIVFPDYRITTPIGKVRNLGHAGVLLIDKKTGLTKYYEYGRYDSEGKGIVRNKKISNVTFGKDGKPTIKSLQRVLSQISRNSGQNGRLEGAYIESNDFESMNSFALNLMDQNNNSSREPYSISSNNCGTFGCEVINQDPIVKKRAPLIVDPRPNSIIKEYQGEFGKVQYNTQTGVTVENVERNKFKEILDNLKKQLNNR